MRVAAGPMPLPSNVCWMIVVWLPALSKVLLDPETLDAFPLPSGPQMTRRMGKSFAQLLTSKAVLMAVGLAGEGGGRGLMLCAGAVDARRRGGGREEKDPWGVVGGRWWMSLAEALAIVETSLEEPCGVSLGGLSVDAGVGESCVWLLLVWDGNDGSMGVEGLENIGASVALPC